MNCYIASILTLLMLGFPAVGEESKKSTSKPIAAIKAYFFSVSLMKLRENTQHKKLEDDELKIVSEVFSSAEFKKKMEYKDVARMPYISRFQFRLGLDRGKPPIGTTEYGSLTMDCRTLHWNEMIYSLDETEAAKLREIFPRARNPLTKSELPIYVAEPKEAEQDVPPKSDRAGG